jgi:RepB DNA-primase N-terminal domain
MKDAANMATSSLKSIPKIDAPSIAPGGIEPDREEAERFLAALDPGAADFTFQTFDDDADRKGLKLAHILHGSFDRRWAELCRLNAAGAGVFVTVNETNGRGRTAADVVRVRALFVDLDGAPLPAKFHAEPHIVVESSRGKWHVYWLVKDCELDAFASLQRRLAAHYGGDKAVHDLPRVLRLPGFVHQKVKDGVRSVPFRSRLVEAHGDA